MTRRRYIWDKDLDCLVEIGTGTNHPDEPPSGMQIIRDQEPYRTAAADIAADGKRVVIGGRRQHREFIKRNGYVEVGNERPIQGERPQLSRNDRIADIRRAMGDG